MLKKFNLGDILLLLNLLKMSIINKMDIDYASLVRKVYHDCVNYINPVKELLRIKYCNDEFVDNMVLNLVQSVETLKNARLIVLLDSQHFFEKQEIDVCGVVEECLTEIEEYYLNVKKDVSYSFNLEAKINTNFFLFETLIYNLIHNAIRFGKKVEIFCDKDSILIENSHELKDKYQTIFNIPVKTDRYGITGSGLGLKVVRKIAKVLLIDITSEINERYVIVKVNF